MPILLATSSIFSESPTSFDCRIQSNPEQSKQKGWSSMNPTEAKSAFNMHSRILEEEIFFSPYMTESIVCNVKLFSTLKSAMSFMSVEPLYPQWKSLPSDKCFMPHKSMSIRKNSVPSILANSEEKSITMANAKPFAARISIYCERVAISPG